MSPLLADIVAKVVADPRDGYKQTIIESTLSIARASIVSAWSIRLSAAVTLALAAMALVPHPRSGLHGFPIKPRVHPFSRLEAGNSFICDRDGSTSAGIAPLTCSSELNWKRSETPQFNSITATQSIDDFVQYRGDDLLYVPRKKVRVLRGNALYEFRFYHGPVTHWILQIGEISVKHES
jgi:hypothetical protein